jgi:hypothetical protein
VLSKQETGPRIMRNWCDAADQSSTEARVTERRDKNSKLTVNVHVEEVLQEKRAGACARPKRLKVKASVLCAYLFLVQ